MPVPDEQLPVILPRDVVLRLVHKHPWLAHSSFATHECPKCGKPPRRETDTFDTFMESSWYYARYACQMPKLQCG